MLVSIPLLAQETKTFTTLNGKEYSQVQNTTTNREYFTWNHNIDGNTVGGMIYYTNLSSDTFIGLFGINEYNHYTNNVVINTKMRLATIQRLNDERQKKLKEDERQQKIDSLTTFIPPKKSVPYVKVENKIVHVWTNSVAIHIITITTDIYGSQAIGYTFKDKITDDRIVVVQNHPLQHQFTTGDTFPQTRCIFVKNTEIELMKDGGPVILTVKLYEPFTEKDLNL